MPTKNVRLTRPGSNPVRDSDRRIADAIKTLDGSHRGKQVLTDLARLFNGPASGLDLGNMSAMVCLVREFAMGSRRGFITDRPAKQFIIKEQNTTGGAFVLGFDGEKVVFTGYEEFAKRFSQDDAQRFLDKYQDAGYMLDQGIIEEAV